MRRPTNRRIVVDVLQYGVGVLAFVWLFRQIDLPRVVDLALAVESGTVVAVLAVTGFGLVARFYTWHVLITPVRRSDLRTAAGIDLVVNFINQLLPSRLSGRAAAPVVLRGRTGMGYPEAVAIAGVHTGLYAVLYGVGTVVGLAFALGRISVGLMALLALSASLYFLAGGFVLLAGANMEVVDRAVGLLGETVRLVPAIGETVADRVRSLPTFAAESAEWFRTLTTDSTTLATYAAGWSGAMLFAPGVRVWLLLGSFGASFEPAILLPLFLLAAYSVTLLPLTPGGIGVSEATATAVFVGLGVPAEVIVPVVFVDRFLGVYLPALVGWYPSIQLDVSGLVAE